MTKLNKLLLHFIVVALSVIVVACGDSDSEPGASSIVGSWYGTNTYDNPAGGLKTRSLSVVFNSDGSGSMEYEAPTLYSAAYFSYFVSGNNIHCVGAYANTTGDVNEDFEWTLEIQGDRIIPQDKFTSFILTRDGSVTTNGSGSEVVDKSNLLKGVWVHTTGETVIRFNESTYDEYVLSEPFGKSYSSHTENDYSYNSYSNSFTSGADLYFITTLTENNLSFKCERTKNTYSYTRGSQSDIPTKNDIAATLIGVHWVSKGYIFYFGTDGHVGYVESTKVRNDHYALDARGTYTLSGNTAICYFETVTWDCGYLPQNKNIFPGWTYNTPCTKRFSFEADGDNLIVTFEDGRTVTLSRSF